MTFSKSLYCGDLFFSLKMFYLQTGGRTDGQTDGRTDGWTDDKVMMTRSKLKNYYKNAIIV